MDFAKREYFAPTKRYASEVCFVREKMYKSATPLLLKYIDHTNEIHYPFLEIMKMNGKSRDSQLKCNEFRSSGERSRSGMPGTE